MPSVAYVVMGNDYPAAVFTTLKAAEDYCEFRKSENKHIYWRVYDFELRS